MRRAIWLKAVSREDGEKQSDKNKGRNGKSPLESSSKKTELVPESKPWDSGCCIKKNKFQELKQTPTPPCWQQKSKLPNIWGIFFFCSIVFYSLNPNSHIPLLPCFHMLETKYKRKNKTQKAGCFIYCQQGWLQLLFNQKELRASEASHDSTEPLLFAIVRLPCSKMWNNFQANTRCNYSSSTPSW